MDWRLIQMGWQNLMQVTRSVKLGKLVSSAILRKLVSISFLVHWLNLVQN
ncbi:Tn3 family transposase [Phormidium tenue FACHB-886]|nr:Tn3 family transposase [Phormidium tenue FACHB-886]